MPERDEQFLIVPDLFIGEIYPSSNVKIMDEQSTLGVGVAVRVVLRDKDDSALCLLIVF